METQTVNREKMARQAKVLRDKKLARMAKLGKKLRPKVESGVVKYNSPVPEEVRKLRQFSAPPTPARTARTVVPQSQQTDRTDMQQQKVNPVKIARRPKGCSGCRRKSG